MYGWRWQMCDNDHQFTLAYVCIDSQMHLKEIEEYCTSNNQTVAWDKAKCDF